MSLISAEKLKVVGGGPQPTFGGVVGRARKEGAIVEFHEIIHKRIVRIVEYVGRGGFKQFNRFRGHRCCCHRYDYTVTMLMKNRLFVRSFVTKSNEEMVMRASESTMMFCCCFVVFVKVFCCSK